MDAGVSLAKGYTNRNIVHSVCKQVYGFHSATLKMTVGT